jgi:hypothetical protein
MLANTKKILGIFFELKWCNKPIFEWWNENSHFWRQQIKIWIGPLSYIEVS